MPEEPTNPLRVAPCAEWVTAEEILNQINVKRAIAQLEKSTGVTPPDEEELKKLAEEAAGCATEMLYERSGRTFSGECGPVKIRPLSRPTDVDQKNWGARLSPLGWFSTWGMVSAFGAYQPGVVSHFGASGLPSVYLGAYPVININKVLIDGVEIPSAQYEIRDHNYLVRLRENSSSIPAARYGWPTAQIMDLPDTEPGTFSVEYTFGVLPPASGVLAARVLGEYLLLPSLGDFTKYPKRVTSVSRQGVSATVADVQDFLKSKMLGIYEVDAFIETYNPNHLARQSFAWSPDLGRARRVST